MVLVEWLSSSRRRPFDPVFVVKNEHQNPHASEKAAISKLPLLVSSALFSFSSLFISLLLSPLSIFLLLSFLHFPLSPHSTMSLSATTKIPQPLPLNSTRSNEKPLFFDPSRSTSNFLGSRFRLPSLSKSITRSRSSTVVAVSDVLKEKKLKPTSNLVLFPILDCRRLFLFTDFSFGGNGVI